MINKRKALKYLESRITELEAQDIFNNEHNNNSIISRALQGLKNIKEIIEIRLEE